MWHIGTCILSIYIYIPIRLLLSLRQQPQLSQRAKTQILGVMRKTVGIAEFLWFLVEASRMVSRKHASFMDVFVFSMYGHLGTPQKSYIDTKKYPKMMVVQMYLLSNMPIWGIHVRFRGCNSFTR